MCVCVCDSVKNGFPWCFPTQRIFETSKKRGVGCLSMWNFWDLQTICFWEPNQFLRSHVMAKHLLMLTSCAHIFPRLLTGRWSHLRREGRWVQLHWELHRLRLSSLSCGLDRFLPGAAARGPPFNVRKYPKTYHYLNRLHPWSLTAHPWKIIVGRLPSFWGWPIFRGELLIL